MWNLIVSVPDHCLSFYFENRTADEIESFHTASVTHY